MAGMGTALSGAPGSPEGSGWELQPGSDPCCSCTSPGGRCLGDSLGSQEQQVPWSQVTPCEVTPQETAGALSGPWGAAAPERSLGRASLTGTIAEIFPLACLLPTSVNNAVDSGKHVFLRRLLFLEEVSWQCLG